jgi:hypothetical protein
MRHCRAFAMFWAAVLMLAGSLSAQPAASVELTIFPGTPLRVVLDRAVTIHRVGQPVTGVLLEPVYAYDRIVVPAGTRVVGHIARLDGAQGSSRALQMASGNFTPSPRTFVQFDRLERPGASAIVISTAPASGVERVVVSVAAESSPEPGVAARAKKEAIARAERVLKEVTAPGRTERLKNAAVQSMPVHPNYLARGTVYTAPIAEAVTFGPADALERAAPGTMPPPESVLVARVLTSVDSRSPRGTPLEAVLTRPVFAPDGRLILPEGTKLTGEVTFSRPAGRFHRNGRLRLLIDRVHVPGVEPQPLLASLHAVDAAEGDRIAVDEEGGATATNSAARFVAPAVATAALAASLQGHLDYDTDGAGPEMAYGRFGSDAIGSFIGMSVFGVVLAQVSRPVTLTIMAAGLVRTGYGAIAGRGRDVSFPAGTAIQVRLAPARRAAPR